MVPPLAPRILGHRVTPERCPFVRLRALRQLHTRYQNALATAPAIEHDEIRKAAAAVRELMSEAMDEVWRGIARDRVAESA